MSKKDKYGSPFDPRNGGKIPKPADKAELPAEPPAGRKTVEVHLETPSMRMLDILRSPPRFSWADVSIEGSGVIEHAAPSRMMEDHLRQSMFGFDVAAEAATPPRSPPASYKEARKAVAKYIAPAPTQAFDDIVGNDEALATLRDAIQAPVKHKALYEAYGMKMPKGALLSGPPGCGKTMFARAAASEMRALYGKEVEFIAIAASELQTMYVGETEKIIRAIFAFAREYRAYHGHPLLVFIDEAETILPDRTGRIRRVYPYEESQVAQFLAEMDGMRESGAFVLLASNRPEVIDQAVLRDGRCDFKIVVKRPNQAAIEEILRRRFTEVFVVDVEREDLVVAAVESLFDPAKIILHAGAIGIDLEQLKVAELGKKSFCLEHIVSGAMATSIPARANRYAFARDKAEGVAKGVQVADVLRAVNDLFEENKRLEHSFALNEFRDEFMAELQAAAEAAPKGKRKGGEGVA